MSKMREGSRIVTHTPSSLFLVVLDKALWGYLFNSHYSTEGPSRALAFWAYFLNRETIDWPFKLRGNFHEYDNNKLSGSSLITMASASVQNPSQNRAETEFLPLQNDLLLKYSNDRTLLPVHSLRVHLELTFNYNSVDKWTFNKQITFTLQS